MAAPSQRRALGALFLLLAVGFAGIAWAAGAAGQWIILAAAAAIDRSLAEAISGLFIARLANVPKPQSGLRKMRSAGTR